MYNIYIDDIVGIKREVKYLCAAKRLGEAERKKEIMDAAAKVIVSKGFEKTTMEDVITGTSLSKGGVYHYYGSVIEILKDIMLCGIEYRNEIIKEHLLESKNKLTKEFMAKEIVTKIIDDNQYMPLYIEFLIAKKRNPELNKVMVELKEQTKEKFKTVMTEVPGWIANYEMFEFVSDFINSMILGANVLEARENFLKNRGIVEQLLIYIFSKAE